MRTPTIRPHSQGAFPPRSFGSRWRDQTTSRRAGRRAADRGRSHDGGAGCRTSRPESPALFGGLGGCLASPVIPRRALRADPDIAHGPLVSSATRRDRHDLAQATARVRRCACPGSAGAGIRHDDRASPETADDASSSGLSIAERGLRRIGDAVRAVARNAMLRESAIEDATLLAERELEVHRVMGVVTARDGQSVLAWLTSRCQVRPRWFREPQRTVPSLFDWSAQSGPARLGARGPAGAPAPRRIRVSLLLHDPERRHE